MKFHCPKNKIKSSTYDALNMFRLKLCAGNGAVDVTALKTVDWGCLTSFIRMHSPNVVEELKKHM